MLSPTPSTATFINPASSRSEMSAKDDKNILAVPREKLFAEGEFEGFMPASKEYLSRISAHGKFLRRGDLEEDPSYKQAIPYVCVIHGKRLLVYERASDTQHAHESRLHGLVSIGVGGHVDVDDGKEPKHAILNALRRELHEEIGTHADMCELIGYINLEDTSVSKVHFGLLYLAHTSGTVRKGAEFSAMEFLSLEECDRRFAEAQVEEWSRIAYEQIRDLLT